MQLAPSLPLQEDFVYHWKAITHYYIETSGKKRDTDPDAVIMFSSAVDLLLCKDDVFLRAPVLGRTSLREI